jgi:hypothetical protein
MRKREGLLHGCLKTKGLVGLVGLEGLVMLVLQRRAPGRGRMRVIILDLPLAEVIPKRHGPVCFSDAVG